MDDQKDISIVFSVNYGHDFSLSEFESLAKSILQRFSVEKAILDFAIVGDKEIASINEEFLGHEGPTDVISFDLSDQNMKNCFEIVVNADQAGRQAAQRNHSIQAELALYITHGMLHNLGYDDLNEKDAKKMHEMEDIILKDAGFGVVYGEN